MTRVEGGHSGGRRDTHVSVTPPEEEGLYWEERRLLERKLRAWLEGRLKEPRSTWISFRVTPTLREVYQRAPQGVKQAARRAFEAVLASWFLGGQTVPPQPAAGASAPQIFNINISISEASASAEAKASIPDALARRLDELEELLEFIAYRALPEVYPKPVRDKARRGLEALAELRRRLAN